MGSLMARCAESDQNGTALPCLGLNRTAVRSALGVICFAFAGTHLINHLGFNCDKKLAILKALGWWPILDWNTPFRCRRNRPQFQRRSRFGWQLRPCPCTLWK
jgi:hypothetical protein